MFDRTNWKKNDMENGVLSEESLRYLEEHKPLQFGNWSASCYRKTFRVNNKGIKLAARGDEGLEKVVFDVERKTVSVCVKNPTLSEKVPRKLDLSESVEFFNGLRDNIESVLMKKDSGFTSVTPNADRTVFTIS